MKKNRLTPHPTAAIFKRHRITIAKIASATGYSQSYISHVLPGQFMQSEALNAALCDYARQLDPSFCIPVKNIL